MKLVIDARMYGLEHAGIGRYVEELIANIHQPLSGDRNLECYLLVRKKNYAKISNLYKGKYQLIVCDVQHYSLSEQIVLPLVLLRIRPDLVHFPHFNVPILYFGKYLVTIHDLIKHKSRGTETTTKTPLLYWLKYLGYGVAFYLGVKRAVNVIVPSETVKKELIKTYRLSANKVIVTYEGYEASYLIAKKVSQEKINKILDKYGISKPFVVYVGSVYPHKNVERLLQVISQLNKKYPLNLVISCARSVFWEKLRRKIELYKLGNKVNLIGFAPDNELAVLLNQAVAFVFPTLSEGFGLPGLEAMAADCPVVCSDIPVLREVYQKAALYFDPYDVGDMADKISRVIDDKKLSSRLIELGRKQIKRYSWLKMAQKTTELYRSCL